MIRAKFSGDFFDAVLVAGDDDDFRALGGVGFRAIASDAATAAGEKNNFILEQKVHLSVKNKIKRDEHRQNQTRQHAVIAEAATAGLAAQRLAPVFPDEQFRLGLERLWKKKRGCGHDGNAYDQ